MRPRYLPRNLTGDCAVLLACALAIFLHLIGVY